MYHTLSFGDLGGHFNGARIMKT